VQLHGGKVVAHSDGPGTGAELEVWLPVLQRVEAEPTADEAPSPASTEAPRPAAERNQRVLIVDDNVDGALTLAEIIEAWGSETLVAHSGIEALELATEHQPDTVLLDIGMPGMDGYEVARRLRAGEAADSRPRTRVIALTGYGQDNDRRRAAEAGFDHHFTKPVDLDALRALLTDG
jgi:CheY-like chemotaxis protein